MNIHRPGIGPGEHGPYAAPPPRLLPGIGMNPGKGACILRKSWYNIFDCHNSAPKHGHRMFEPGILRRKVVVVKPGQLCRSRVAWLVEKRHGIFRQIKQQEIRFTKKFCFCLGPAPQTHISAHCQALHERITLRFCP
jgi:hypothetical protein